MSGKAPAEAGRLVITLVRGLAGKKQVYKDTCQVLGLNKTWRTTDKPNNASVRGMVQKVAASLPAALCSCQTTLALSAVPLWSWQRDLLRVPGSAPLLTALVDPYCVNHFLSPVAGSCLALKRIRPPLQVRHLVRVESKEAYDQRMSAIAASKALRPPIVVKH